MNQAYLVFSDLDGTLLDHESYSYADALPALELLLRNDIPLILCSSKTAAELTPLRDELGFGHCAAIVENGAGILEPYAQRIGGDPVHAKLLNLLGQLPATLRQGFSGFSDWSIDEIQARTGLGREAALRARQRDFSEPGLWSQDQSALENFRQELATVGVSVQQGGRFLTLSMAGSKLEAMTRIVKRYRIEKGDGFKTIALGDAPNDIEMIEAADMGVIIPNPSHAGIRKLAGEDGGQIQRAEMVGPAGWNQVLTLILQALS